MQGQGTKCSALLASATRSELPGVWVCQRHWNQEVQHVTLPGSPCGSFSWQSKKKQEQLSWAGKGLEVVQEHDLQILPSILASGDRASHQRTEPQNQFHLYYSSGFCEPEISRSSWRAFCGCAQGWVVTALLADVVNPVKSLHLKDIYFGEQQTLQGMGDSHAQGTGMT